MRNWFGKDLNDLRKVNLYSFQHLYKMRNWFGKDLNDLRRVLILIFQLCIKLLIGLGRI